MNMHLEVNPRIITNTRFCILYVRMNHFEAYLMIPSGKFDSKVVRIAIAFGVFSFWYRQNGECKVKNLDSSSMVWVMMYQHSKSAFWQITLNFELG